MSTQRGCRWLAAGLAGLLIAGCASENPREGGFLGGVAGLSSGKYDERIRTREDSLMGLKQARTELESEQVGLESQKVASQRRLQANRAQLARLSAESKALSIKVAGLKSEDSQRQGQIADLKRRTSEFQGKVQQADRAAGADALEGGGTAAPNARQQQLENQRRQLEEEYRLLTDMYRKLGS
jgi:predicted  nucleic acid-binding Zn-ribbon protein